VIRMKLPTAAIVVVVASATTVQAQMVMPGDSAPVMDARSAAHLRDSYINDLDSLHAKVLALATAIPADKYAWRPGSGVRSVSEVLMHIASEWYVFTPMSVASAAPPDFVPATTTPAERRTAMNAKLKAMETTTNKDAVLADLDKSWAYCKSQLTSADPSLLTGRYKPWGVPLDDAAFIMAGDLHEHLGQLIAYSRMLGVKPPWSK
jgi:uncharacterized damage-inducible protein DinB